MFGSKKLKFSAPYHTLSKFDSEDTSNYSKRLDHFVGIIFTLVLLLPSGALDFCFENLLLTRQQEQEAPKKVNT